MMVSSETCKEKVTTIRLKTFLIDAGSLLWKCVGRENKVTS